MASGQSGQSVNVSTSVSTPSSLDLSKPTSIFNSTSVVSIGTASSSSTLSSTSVDSFRSGSSILNSTSVVSSGTALSSSILNSTSVGISSSSMALFVPTTSTSTTPTSQVLSSTASSLPENGFSSSPPLSKSSQTGLPSSPPTSPSATKSESTPKSTASKTAGSSVHHSSEPGSTITSVIVATSSWEETSTFTTRPTSTLSTRVVFTTTNSIGSQVVTTPPLVTIWSTSTDSNGTLFTSTEVAANAPQADLTHVTGILHNTGAVAGIFSVVGVVFASLVVCMVICIRRRRKNRQREKWLSGMRAQQPRSFSDDPFRDDSLPPLLRTVNTDTEVDPWDRKGFLTPEDSNHGHMTFGQTKASIFPVYPTSKNGTFSHPEIHQQTIDMESPTESNRARHSLAPSTPSIYPVSVEDEDKDLIIVPIFNQIATGSNLPPRPPRSHLRRSIKDFGSGLPTPPESSEHSIYTNIVSEPRSLDYVHILDRKTILDVQSRLITE